MSRESYQVAEESQEVIQPRESTKSKEQDEELPRAVSVNDI